jgi:hypothetical protein
VREPPPAPARRSCRSCTPVAPALDLLRVGDQHLPPEPLKRVVHEPRPGHRLDHPAHRQPIAAAPARQAPQAVDVRRRGELLDHLRVLTEQTDIEPVATQIQSSMQHEDGPPGGPPSSHSKDGLPNHVLRESPLSRSTYRTVEHRESVVEIERYFGADLVWQPLLPKRTAVQDATRRGVPVGELARRPAREVAGAMATLARGHAGVACRPLSVAQRWAQGRSKGRTPPPQRRAPRAARAESRRAPMLWARRSSAISA